MRAQRRTPEEQLEMVLLCQASGLTIAEWCRREGIIPDTYSTWVERLQKRGISKCLYYFESASILLGKNVRAVFV